MTKRPTICYVYRKDAADPMVQSGRPFAIRKGFAEWASVIDVFPVKQTKWLALAHAGQHFWYRYRGWRYAPYNTPAAIKAVSRRAMAVEKHIEFDCFFAPNLRQLAFVDTPKPIIVVDDAPMTLLSRSYEVINRIAPNRLAEIEAIERAAVGRASLLVFPSHWAADFVQRHFACPAAKLRVIPFGANVDAPTAAALETLVEQRRQRSPRVLFVGLNWRRKCGDLVVEACRRVRRSVPALTLDVVGNCPPELPDFVNNHGRLDVRTAAGTQTLRNLYAQASLLFVPSSGEAYGMTFCEAAAFGLPVLSRAVGGIPSIVEHGKTGTLLAADANVDDFADALAALLRDQEQRLEMSRNARAAYEQRLNWPVFSRRLRGEINRCLAAFERLGRPSAVPADGVIAD